MFRDDFLAKLLNFFSSPKKVETFMFLIIWIVVTISVIFQVVYTREVVGFINPPWPGIILTTLLFWFIYILVFLSVRQERGLSTKHIPYFYLFVFLVVTFFYLLFLVLSLKDILLGTFLPQNIQLLLSLFWFLSFILILLSRLYSRSVFGGFPILSLFASLFLVYLALKGVSSSWLGYFPLIYWLLRQIEIKLSSRLTS